MIFLLKGCAVFLTIIDWGCSAFSIRLFCVCDKLYWGFEGNDPFQVKSVIPWQCWSVMLPCGNVHHKCYKYRGLNIKSSQYRYNIIILSSVIYAFTWTVFFTYTCTYWGIIVPPVKHLRDSMALKHTERVLATGNLILIL